jgi:hypothetical protein
VNLFKDTYAYPQHFTCIANPFLHAHRCQQMWHCTFPAELYHRLGEVAKVYPASLTSFLGVIGNLLPPPPTSCHLSTPSDGTTALPRQAPGPVRNCLSHLHGELCRRQGHYIIQKFRFSNPPLSFSSCLRLKKRVERHRKNALANDYADADW